MLHAVLILSATDLERRRDINKVGGLLVLTYPAEDDQRSGEPKAGGKGGKDHGAREQDMPHDPDREQLRLHLVQPLDQMRNALRRPRRKAPILGGADEQGEQPRTSKSHEGINRQRVAANPTHVAQGIRRVVCLLRHVVAEVGLADPGTPVHVEGEPADPAPEHRPADALDARRQVQEGRPDLVEHLEAALGAAAQLVAWDDQNALGHGPARGASRDEDAQGGDEGELLELGGAEPGPKGPG